MVASPEAIVEWRRGTGLRPFLNALDDEDRAAFLAEYLEAIRPHYPSRSGGRTLFPFRRLFPIAYRSEPRSAFTAPSPLAIGGWRVSKRFSTAASRA